MNTASEFASAVQTKVSSSEYPDMSISTPPRTDLVLMVLVDPIRPAISGTVQREMVLRAPSWNFRICLSTSSSLSPVLGDTLFSRKGSKLCSDPAFGSMKNGAIRLRLYRRHSNMTKHSPQNITTPIIGNTTRRLICSVLHV